MNWANRAVSVMEAEQVGRRLAVFGLDGDSVPPRLRLAIAKVCRKMDSLGCEITRVHRSSDSVEGWCVEWRAKGQPSLPAVYGASGATAVAAVRAALANAESDLREAPWSGSGVGAAPTGVVQIAADGSRR